MTREARRAFRAAAAAVIDAHARRGGDPREGVAPALLAQAVEQALEVCDRSDADRDRGGALSPADVTEIANHALDCLFDLAIWAERLDAPQYRNAIELLALDVALWAVRHDGEIHALEPVVNALAHRANSTESREELAALLEAARTIISHVAPVARAPERAIDPAWPWRVLNFNFAIIATRTQDAGRMQAAYDLLEQHLPADCASFFEEGVREAQKKVYEPHVREALRQRLAKWTGRH